MGMYQNSILHMIVLIRPLLCCFIISAFYENLYGYAYFLRLSRFKNKKYALFPKKLCQNSLFA